MPPTYVLARDHLERAATILQGTDSRSQQLRHIIERTIALMDDFRRQEAPENENILDLESIRRQRGII
ncbi:hypothetical protein VW29_08560 [Devosia limi DSM 17137]|uniref:Uncharacterized protein n=1 Tax=Devosia limi DSM 17137 TaxID=1121477 RepID=A0A0F5LRT6_9HYPH|nr:hypothetical protein [Devosia limi]KKB84874.1 hypothetical protein VW29_08560 [Devosia limi DSM 17137]SHF07466.1 hypothetical protein SAMN02745223_01754 [Devosia limi DSM 17137]